MEKMKDAPVPEGEDSKSDAEIVEEVLKTEVNIPQECWDQVI